MSLSDCVLCPVSPPECKPCAKYYQCVVLSQSCTKCATSECQWIEGSPTPTNAGAIAGGVIGGVVVLAALGFLYWKYFYKAKRIEIKAEVEADKEFYATYDEGRETTSTVEPAPRRNGPSRVPGGRDNASRLSRQVSTSTANTDASNIIPIAYIPGVTIRQNVKTKLVYSAMDGESLFSDWNTLEEASIIERKASQASRNNITTAIRAQPTVVEVESGTVTHLGLRPSPQSDRRVALMRSASTTAPNSSSRLQHELVIEEEELEDRATQLLEISHFEPGDDPFVIHEEAEDTDDDSDREAIEAATSAHNSNSRSASIRPSMPLLSSRNLSHMDEASIAESGSFIMDFEMDIEPSRASPFSDS